ncbi:MAG: hypothetical protein ISS50_02890 [Anaerolineae bacterium]|nr:hypothetical protein [Anaerolineae bacterium]
MRFRYSTTDPTQSELDSLPRLPLVLRYGQRTIHVVGLVDSGATVNVLPYRFGVQLGAVWDDQKATIRLAGNLGNVAAQPLFPIAKIGDFPPIRLAFAWSRSDDIPLILGQMNFFMEFDICFYRSQLEFEVKLKSH